MSNYIKPAIDNLSVSTLTNATLLDDNTSIFSIREWPILIGALVGAIGLIILIIASILIWFCCQYANNSNNTYRLNDDDSDCHNFSYENGNKITNEQRNFSRINRVLLLRPSEMNLCRDTSRSLSSNLSSNFGNMANYTTNHLPINYQIGKSPALLRSDANDIDTRFNQSVNLC